MKPHMTSFEHEFLTGKWQGVKGAAYNATAEFCQDFGWTDGFHFDGTPSVTPAGMAAIAEYEA